jgi:hypothetical protein
MKNSLTVLALVLAAAVPVAFIIELAGTRLPTIVDSAHLGAAFMLTFLFKIMLADYARTVDTALMNPATILALPSPAAAKSSFRLAA